jgi:predicted DNA-binding protein YlxM (UPF0122 family)
MLDKQTITLMYQHNQTYASIARTLGVSRQRIHQIIKNYHNLGKKDREKKYKNFDICLVCKIKKAIYFHHIDFDNTNDSEKNLLPICKICHSKLHARRKRDTVVLREKWSRDYEVCINCLKNSNKHSGHGLCTKCYYSKYGK